MKETLFVKIIKAHCKDRIVAVGDIVEVPIDRMMIHDFFIPFCIDKFREMGFTKVFDPGKIVFINDHLVPTSFVGDYRHHKAGEDFVREQNIPHYLRSDGICHQLMHEQGFIKPGDIVLGTDSHTTTYGALGILATGIGYTEMASVMGTGKLWLKVVPTIRVKVDGEMSTGVYSKDVILQLLKDIGTDGATYKSIEFAGSTIRNMSIDSRLTLSNMSVEAGAKTGLIESDEKTIEYLKPKYKGGPSSVTTLASDPDALYEREIVYDASKIPPLVACPHSVDKVSAINELGNVPVNEAFLGSCTNGRLEDFAVAAQIMKGKKAHPHVRFIVVPASRKIYMEAAEKGYLATLAEAGAIINHPSCGLCAGRSGGILEAGEKIIASNNRNFLGRMGSNKAEIYLGSPATVAASALEGKIADPRKYL